MDPLTTGSQKGDTLKILKNRQLAALLIHTSASLLITTGMADAQTATITIIDDPQIYGVTAAWDVTPDGSMVVGVSEGRVFRYTSAGGVEIMSPQDYQHTAKATVSDDGSVLVSTVEDPGGIFSPAYWTQATGWVTVGGIPGQPSLDGQYGSGWDVSGDGAKMVGLAWDGSNGKAEAFQWTDATGVVGLGRTADRNSRASVISADGHVIGGFYEDPTTGCRRPVRWIDAGAPDLFLGDSVCGETKGFTRTGAYITGEAAFAGDFWYNGFLYSDAGGVIKLPPAVNNVNYRSMGISVSEGGIVVGRSGLGGQTLFASIWYPGDERMRDLADELTSLGADPGDWWLLSAIAITPDGATIVGQAFNSITSQYGAFIATIPGSTVFNDDFEDGTTDAWSAVSGGGR